jgi:O-antigen ligase
VSDVTSPPRLSLALDKPDPSESRAAALLLSALIGIVALAPLPLAANRPWAWETLTALVGLTLVGAGILQLLRPNLPRGRFAPVRIPAMCLAVAMGWAAIQCLPFTPAAWHHPLWSQAREYLGPDIATSISIDRIASISHLFRLAAYAGIFWLSYSACRDARNARTVLMSVTVIVVVYAGWGLFVYWTGNNTILWFKKWAYVQDLTSTFVNRNSFATFIGIGLICCIALLLEAMRKRIDFSESRRGVLKAVLEFLISDARWLTLASLGLATALLLTHSRGGAISTSLGLAALLVCVNMAPSLRARWHIAFGIGLAITLGMSLVISDNVMTGRIADGLVEPDGRLRIFGLVFEAIGDWPLFGTGLGSFPDVFPLYRTEDLPLLIDRAHNDYLETIVELGFPAALALFLSMIWLLMICLRGVRQRRRDAIFPCIGVGVTTLVGAHAVVDFSLQMPGVTALYWLLMGATVAQSYSSAQRAE